MGSEMCIRDRLHPCGHAHVHARAKWGATDTASGPHNDGGVGNYGDRDFVYGDFSWGGDAPCRTFGGVPVPGKNVNWGTVICRAVSSLLAFSTWDARFEYLLVEYGMILYRCIEGYYAAVF